MAEIGGGPEIVVRPNPNYGKERTQLVPSTTVDIRRRAAAEAGLDDFSVLNGPGGHYVRDGKTYMVPKNKAMVRDGWEGITDPDKLRAYQEIFAKLIAEQRVKRKRK